MYYTGSAQADMNKYEFGNFEGKTRVYQEPHQLLLRNWVSQNTLSDNVLLYHGLGTGKTCSVISIAEGLKEYLSKVSKKVLVITANDYIKNNFENELLSRCTDYINETDMKIYEKNIVDIMSTRGAALAEKKKEIKTAAKAEYKKVYQFNTYEKLVRDIRTGTVTDFNDRVVVIDEVHNIISSRTEGSVYEHIFKILKKSYNYRLILLSATPITDSCSEILYISNLLNANEPERLFHNTRDVLVKKSSLNVRVHADMQVFTEEGLLLLRKALKDKVSFMSPNVKSFPKQIDIGTPLTIRQGSTRVVSCEMSAFQSRHYVQAFNSDRRLYVAASDASSMVFPDGTYGTEATSLTLEQEGEVFGMEGLTKYSTKLRALVENLKKSVGTSFVFSERKTGGGTSLIRMALKTNGFVEYKGSSIIHTSDPKFVVLTGDDLNTYREQVRKVFNSEANLNGSIIKVLVGTGVMSEGITFKCVRNVHLFEPHWNFTSTDQAIGRAIRNNSHKNLPLEDRNVRVYRYMAIGSRSEPRVGVQDFFYIERQKYILSEAKDRINRGVFRLLKEISIDCTHNKKVYDDFVTGKVDYSKECDYQTCQFTCQIVPSQVTDKSTYNLGIRFFDKFDILLISEVVVDLFKKYFIWKIQDIYDECVERLGNVTKEAVLVHMSDSVKNKVEFTDMYGRKGLLVHRTGFYIFNPDGKDLTSSVFTKTLDFTTRRDSTPLPKKVTFESKSDDVASIKMVAALTKKELDHNAIIKRDNKIYGTYRDRSGAVSNVFKLVVIQEQAQESRDLREVITGTGIHSYQLDQLRDVSKRLGITVKSSYRKGDLSKLIIDHLTEHNLILF